MHGLRAVVWGVTLAILIGGCAVYMPQSEFQQAYHDKALKQVPVATGDVTVQWFGVSTLLFRVGEQAILIDGFFSRPDAWRTALENLGPDLKAAEKALMRAGAGPIAAIFVAHAHHDHAQDAPALARDSERKVTLYGSGSVLNLARGYDVPAERLRLIRPNAVVEVADFRVTAVPTPHAESIFPAAGIDEPYTLPLHALGYSAGPNYSFFIRRGAVNVLVVPSANYEPVEFGDAFGDERADLVFLGIGSLGKREDSFIRGFWEASVRRRGAKQVVLIHWDAFTHGLDDPPRPFNWPFDDVGHAYRMLCKLAHRDGVMLKFIKPYELINLTALAATPLETIDAPFDRCR